MVYKTLKTSQSGLSFIEILISVTIAFVLITVTLAFSNIGETQKTARDQKRISDLTLLETAIIEYAKVNDTYPDLEDTLRESTVLPQGASDLANSRGFGWISQDMQDQLPSLPLDPKNDSTYFYSYIHTESSYELNARLEQFTQQAQNDGGNDENIYEIGTQLDIL